MADQSGGRDQPSPAGSDRDREFEPTVDMMVNDFDDEGTLDEAEASETAEQQRTEADLLQQEQDMPIEKLLAMYGRYPGGSGDGPAPPPAVADQPAPDDAEASQSSSTSEEAASNQELGLDKEEASGPEPGDREVPESSGPPPAKKARRSALAALYPDLEPAGGGGKRALRSEVPAEDGIPTTAADDAEESDSSESSGDDSNWRKTIMIGSVYQAQIPDGLSHYGDTPPYENEDKLLWDPAALSAADVERYLGQVQEARLQTASGLAAVPSGCHVRDHEQALFLLQQCGHSVEEAMRRTQMSNHQPIDALSLWSEEECANFENGLRFYGKDFYTIQQQKVRTRSVGELVQFYYLWKKTERHDVFANKTKMEKRKYALNPGVTDYMDRFLEEQDRDPNTAGGRGDGDSAPSLQILMATDGAQLKRWPPSLAPATYPGPVQVSLAGAAVLVGSGAHASSKHLQQ
ncbi:mesoderm induction early response protein 1-like [Pollicipes pollicipes]|uniref:mesoderm induction early response protein 1-like n=1 Tax=Pollicipes pollicipes TaxID=41117 RepID=UPI0018857F37|nr:mesoderm induction early response protein 1-like [Pollicipes pollicipes]